MAGAKGGDRAAIPRFSSDFGPVGRPPCPCRDRDGIDGRRDRDLRLARIDNVVVDAAIRDNLDLDDERDLSSRENRLVSIVATGEKCVVYVNSRDQSVALCRTLRRRVPELGERIAFYNAGLSRADRAVVESAFRDGALTCIVSTSAFGEA